MNKIINIFIAVSAVFLASILPSDGAEPENLRVFLSMEKTRFYSGEDLVLKTSVKNTTGSMLSFKVYDSPDKLDIYSKPRGDVADFTSFKPMVYDMNGRSAEIIVPYVIESKNRDEVFSWMRSRKIVLAPGETFIHKQNLREIYNIKKKRKYRLKLHFLPDAGDESRPAIVSSNELVFSVAGEPRYRKEDIKFTGECIVLQPSEVVLLVLAAEREKNWDRAVRYLDLAKFIHVYPQYSRNYRLADDYDKKRIESDFTRYLKSDRVDSLVDFKILRENIEESGLVSYVEVAAERKSAIRPDRYRYRYRLERKSNKSSIWLITGLEASVIKGRIK